MSLLILLSIAAEIRKAVLFTGIQDDRKKVHNAHKHLLTLCIVVHVRMSDCCCCFSEFARPCVENHAWTGQSTLICCVCCLVPVVELFDMNLICGCVAGGR